VDDLREHWVPRSRLGLGFSPGPLRFFFVHRPPHLPTGFHPPASSPPSPEFYGLRAALRAWLNLATQPTGRRAPPMGSSSLFAASAGGVHHSAGNPDPAVRSVLDVSHVLDGLLRHLPSRACFIPLPRPGFCPSGVCPCCGAVPGFPGRFMPSCRWARPPVTSARALDFRALLPAASAVSVETGWVPTDPLPSWASAPPGAPSAQRGNAFAFLPPPTLHREEPLTAGPRRLAAARIGLPGIRLPTRSSFLA
jgi:hypothetical protein